VDIPPSEDREDLEVEFDRMAFEGDDSASRAILAAGRPIYIAREDTPPDHVIRVYPDGREEIVLLDREAAAKILGR
jgi:hypothetical protein